MTIDDIGILNKKVVSFDFHGTLVERQRHHHHYNPEDATKILKPVFDIFKMCIKKGIKTYIISFESINGSGEEGIENNYRILKQNGVDFPKENIFCTDYKSKDAWFEDLDVQFHVDDEIGVVLLARQMGIGSLLVDYNQHPVVSLFNRIKHRGKIISGSL
jgi:hypothetical protein